MNAEPAQIVYNKIYATMKNSKYRPKGMLRQSLYIWKSISATPYRMAGAPDGQPIPSAQLLHLVAGTPDIRWFLYSGYLGARSIVNTLKNNGLNIRKFDSILDFGCGCGRIIRHLNFLVRTQLYGSDYNPKLVNWCKSNLPFAEFNRNSLKPPMRYDKAKFDFVYALSVFTHLPEQLQFLWRDEILRVLKPSGILLITLHGEHYLHELTPVEQDLYQDGELIVRQGKPGSNFCNAYHPTRYVRNMLAKGFQILDFIPKGAEGNPYQDVFLLKKL